MPSSRPIILSSALVIAAFALLAAGCGGGGSAAGVASVTTSTTAATTTSTATVHDKLVAYSQCMRTHGDPSFPDPQHFVGGNVKLTINQEQSRDPHFEAAMTACSHLLPPNRGGSQQTEQQKRTELADELSFAKCMRSHGVSRFPDPTAAGELSVASVQAQGIDVHSPQVLRVVTACLPASHGALNAAKVREALNNAGH
jgi:hypothetical protein